MGFRLMVLLFVMTSGISLALLLAMRRGAVRGGFVALWLVICVGMVTLPILEPVYKNLAALMGLNFALDMMYIFAILFLMLYAFYLTIKLQRIADTVEILLARVAILSSSPPACGGAEEKPSPRLLQPTPSRPTGKVEL